MIKIKRILAAAAAVTMLAAGTVTANAYPRLFPVWYEAGSAEYMECISDMTKVPYEEKLGVLLNSALGQKWYSVYYAKGRSDETFIDEKYSSADDPEADKYLNVNEYIIEIDDPNNDTQKDHRRFLGVELYFNWLYEMDGRDGRLSNSVESINEFLESYGYDAKVELRALCEGGYDELYITYGKAVDTQGMTDILYALYKEFELEPFTYGTFGSLVIAGASLSAAGEGEGELDNACEAVLDFIVDNDIAALPSVDDSANAVVVTYSNYEDMARTADALKAYMSERGMGNVAITIYGPTDPVLEEAMRLINGFIDETDHHASASIDTDMNDVVTVNIYNWWEADETEADIKAFMKENDIDEGKVSFLVFEDGSSHIFGDANGDGDMNVRDCAYIAKKLSEGKGDSLPVTADYNRDGKKNVRDAAAIAGSLAKK